MKFEKINDNKLKITLKSDEFPYGNDLDNFMQNPEKAKKSMMELLEVAYDEVGFDSKNYKLEIQAKQLIDGTFIFIINKILKLKNIKKTKKEINKNKNKEKRVEKINKPQNLKSIKVKPIKIPKIKDNAVIYKFHNLDDFVEFCNQLKLKKFRSFKTFCEYSELYKINDIYYLVVVNINETHKKIGIFYTNITEFSEFYSSSILKYYSLREKYSPLVKEDALRIGQML